jgi:hypothetical protein
VGRLTNTFQDDLTRHRLFDVQVPARLDPRLERGRNRTSTRTLSPGCEVMSGWFVLLILAVAAAMPWLVAEGLDKLDEWPRQVKCCRVTTRMGPALGFRRRC